MALSRQAMRLYMRQRRYREKAELLQQERDQLRSSLAEIAVGAPHVKPPEPPPPEPAEPPRRPSPSVHAPIANAQSEPDRTDYSLPQNQWRGGMWKAKGFEHLFEDEN
jgi:hypothetical protein